jgi:hypothetical protein
MKSAGRDFSKKRPGLTRVASKEPSAHQVDNEDFSRREDEKFRRNDLNLYYLALLRKSTKKVEAVVPKVEKVDAAISKLQQKQVVPHKATMTAKGKGVATGQLWTDKYRPQTYHEFFGNNSLIEKHYPNR